MGYEVRVTHRAARELRRIDQKDRVRIAARIDQLAIDARLLGPDTDLPDTSLRHYELDASLIDFMLTASVTVEHVMEYLFARSPDSDELRIRQAATTILSLESMR